MIELLALILFLGSWILFYRNKMNNRPNFKLGLTMIGVSILYYFAGISWAFLQKSSEIATGAVIFSLGLLGSSLIMLISHYVTTTVRKRGSRYF